MWRAVAKYGVLPLWFVFWGASLSEAHWIDRTVGAVRLYGSVALAGVLVGLLLVPLIGRLFSDGEPWIARISYFVLLATGISAMLVFFASVFNRAYAPTDRKSMTVSLLSKGYMGRSSSTPYVSLEMPNGKETFKVDQLVWSQAGTELRIFVSPGNLGFDRVVRFEVPQ